MTGLLWACQVMMLDLSIPMLQELACGCFTLRMLNMIPSISSAAATRSAGALPFPSSISSASASLPTCKKACLFVGSVNRAHIIACMHTVSHGIAPFLSFKLPNKKGYFHNGSYPMAVIKPLLGMPLDLWICLVTCSLK